MKVVLSSKNALFLVVALMLLVSPSLTQALNKGSEKDAEAQTTIPIINNKETLISLNDYPSFEISTGSERASLRNPFSAQDSKKLSNLTSPKIIVRGFGSDQYQDTVFISLNNEIDNEFTLGQQVGNGFRVSYISPTKGVIEISNGTQRIQHKAQEF